jgi:hypothetical protein
MYAGIFPQADSVESKVYAFDFRKGLAKDETLTGADFEISVIDGSDPAAVSHLIGPAIVSGTQARQRIAGLVPGVEYEVQAVVTTNQGSTKSLWGRVACVI